MSLEQDWKEYLRNPTRGKAPGNRQKYRNKLYELTSHRVYLGYLPQRIGPVAIRLLTLTRRPRYGLLGPTSCTQSLVQFDLTFRDSADPNIDITTAGEWLRVIIDGFYGTVGSTTIHDAQLQRASYLAPDEPIDASDVWREVYSYDFWMTHSQLAA